MPEPAIDSARNGKREQYREELVSQRQTTGRKVPIPHERPSMFSKIKGRFFLSK
jgi:hypothetical protein